MGEIGGGNLPQRVAGSTEGLGFPPHATAGHDFNLVTEREVDTVIAAADRAADRVEYAERATESHHVAQGEAGILAQAFGDDAMLVASYAPNYADDVEYAVGLSAVAEARAGGLREAMVVDAHNSNDGLSGEDLGHVTPGSERSFDMLGAARTAGIDLSDAPRQRLGLGVAWERTDWTPTDGIGPLGVRVAVVEAGEQRTAYVLVDGNNMEPGLRGRLVEAVTEHVDAAEVMTTDTHIVNTVEADNQVGAAIDHDELEAVVVDLVGRAADDCEPVVAGMATERATVTVFGNDRTETLASHANAMISMGGALAAAFVTGVTAVSALVFFLT
jgi:putative membrane protein